MIRSKAALITFIRNPQPGKGKTRIAAKVGWEEAHRIYLELLEETRRLSASYAGPKYLYYADFIDFHDGWDNGVFLKRLQAKGDLGERMSAAFRDVLGEHTAAIIIGSDCPEIRTEDLEETDRKLAQSDLVIGPSEDGGYYLLGMRSYYPLLFSGIPWSSPLTFARTMERAEQLNLHIERLRLLNDIDTIEDWDRWKRKP